MFIKLTQSSLCVSLSRRGHRTRKVQIIVIHLECYTMLYFIFSSITGLSQNLSWSGAAAIARSRVGGSLLPLQTGKLIPHVHHIHTGTIL